MKPTPGTMRAAISAVYGGPQVLTVKEVPTPDCRDDQMLVRIHASTVNRTDCGFLRAKPSVMRLISGLLRPKNQILGCEFAGEVVIASSTDDRFSVGDCIVGYMDDDYGFGGHAEYVAVPRHAMLARIPGHLSFAQAAAAFEGSHYALQSICAANIGKDHRVLINGATGAIGSAAVQLVHERGAHVTAVCGTDHLDLVSALGADQVIDYLNDDFTAINERFDFVIDAVGKSTFAKCRRILAETGIYMSSELGPWLQNPLLALVTRLVGKQKVLFPIPSNTQQDADYIADLMEHKRFTPVVDRIYPLAEIADAYRYVETGMKTGNVVIQVA